MEIKVEELEPGIVQISIGGRFDAEGGAEIRSQFMGALNPPDRLVIVEMSGVDLLASSGIRLLLAGAKTMKAGGGKLVIASAQSQVEYPITVSGVDTVVPLFKSVDLAMNAM